VYQLVLVAPHEYFTPGTPPGYAGLVAPVTAGYPVTLTVRILNMTTFQLLTVNETVALSSSATRDQIRDLPAQVNLVNGEGTVTVRLMDPATTYTISAAPLTMGFVLPGNSRPIPCNAGTHSLNPYVLVRHTSIAPVTAVQGERQLSMLSLFITNPNGAGAAAYDVRGVTLTVSDRHGVGIPAQDILASISLWDRTAPAQLVQLSTLPAQSRMYVPIIGHALLVYPGETREINLLVDLNPNSTYDELRLSVDSAEDMDCAFLDTTAILVRASSPDAFPMNSNTVAIRLRGLKESFINYPNPFAAGKQGTQIEYFLEQDAQVSLKLYSITGEPVRTLVEAETQIGGQGLHRYVWDGRNGKGDVVFNGVYFAVLTVKPAAGGAVQTLVLKIAVIK
jgi:hypothetical protein